MLATFAGKRSRIIHTDPVYQSRCKAAAKLLQSDTKIRANAEQITRSFRRCTGPIAAAGKIKQAKGNII